MELTSDSISPHAKYNTVLAHRKIGLIESEPASVSISFQIGRDHYELGRPDLLESV